MIGMKIHKMTTLLGNDCKKKDKKTNQHLLHIQQVYGSLLVYLFHHHSIVGVSLRVLIPAMLLYFLQVQPYLI